MVGHGGCDKCTAHTASGVLALVVVVVVAVEEYQ